MAGWKYNTGFITRSLSILLQQQQHSTGQKYGTHKKSAADFGGSGEGPAAAGRQKIRQQRGKGEPERRKE